MTPKRHVPSPSHRGRGTETLVLCAMAALYVLSAFGVLSWTRAGPILVVVGLVYWTTFLRNRRRERQHVRSDRSPGDLGRLRD